MNKYIDDSWDFRNENTKTLTHGFHPYPAMMIPQIANRLIKKYGNGGNLLDPYCGTGTSLVEARVLGMNSWGIDTNPLARLISRVKTTLIEPESLKDTLEMIKGNLLKSKVKNIPKPFFNNLEFWFSESVINDLSLLKKCIYKIKDEKIKEFFLVPFSRTVRGCSYQRSGEFKLYRIKAEKIKDHKADVFATFLKYANSNIKGMVDFFSTADKKAWCKILDTDTRNGTKLESASVDLIVTSPPYGDSRTTVAYGQFSRLALQWMDFDVDEVRSIDKLSLGGFTVKELSHNLKSKTLEKYVSLIAEIDQKRAKEVLSFYLDFDLTLKEIDRLMKKNGHICYVVGNRTVKGKQIETDLILAELMEKRGYKHIETVVRNIPNKRMPSVNSPSNVKGQTSGTMINEYIVVMKKM